MLINRTPGLVQLLNDLEEHQWPRPYLGMSMIGEPCERKLQYYFRFAARDRINAKLQRIFRDGRVLELEIIKALENTGMIILDKQHESIGFAGHEKGHCDGVAVQIPGQPPHQRHLLEIKTHNKKNFDAVVKLGVRKAKPLHYAQMQKYMPDLCCNDYMYVAYCKDDSAIWIEFGGFDKEFYDSLCEKAERVIASDKLQPRIGTGQITWHECKYCNYKGICHNGDPIEKTCRSCEHISVEDGGQWFCLKHERDGDVDDQIEACSDYSLDKVYFDL